MKTRDFALSFLACVSFTAALGACTAHDRASSPAGPESALTASGSSTAEVPTAAAEDDVFARARANLEEARAAWEQGDHAAARAKAGEAIEGLLSTGERELSAAQADMLSDLGGFAYRTGDLKAAERAARAVIDVRLRTLPADDPELQRARGNLAKTLGSLGDLAGARVLQEQVLEVFSRTLPEDDPDLHWARENLAVTLRRLGDLPGARALQEQVLEVYSRTLPVDNPDLLRAQGNLAATLFTLGDLQGARALGEQVLEVRSRTLPADDPDLQWARENQAMTLASLGDLAGARALQEQVLEVYSRTLPADHPDLQSARGNLLKTRRLLGDLAGVAEARALEEQVLEVYSHTLPADHPYLQGARANLAETLLSLGDLQGARALQEQVVEVYSRTLPEDHPDLQGARGNLAAMLVLLGDLPGARALQEQVVEVYSRTLPADHPYLQGARGNLAETLRSLGDLAGARALQEQVLEVRSRTLPDDHPDLQRARGNLASTLFSLDDLQGARALGEQVLDVFSRTLPADHPDLQRARGNLAATLRLLGDVAGARALQEQVLEAHSRTLPADHPELQVARGNLTTTLATEGALASGAEGQERKERCATLVHSLADSDVRIARAATLSCSSREAEERCANLASDLSRVLSFADGYGVFDPDPGLARDAFALSETTRGSALVGAAFARLARSDQRYGDLREEIRAAGSELARLAQSGATPEAYDALVAKRDEAQRELVRLASQFPEAASFLIAPDPAALSERLSEGDAVVAYRRYTRWEMPAGEAQERSTESLCAFVLRKGAVLQLVELGAIEPIEAAVEDWRAAFRIAEGRGGSVLPPSARRPDATQAATQLRALVLDPLGSNLQGVNHLVLILDDVLQAVPMDALPAMAREGGSASNGLELLGDRYEIELHSTTQELSSRSTPLGGEPLVLLVGGVNYSAEPAVYSHDLPGGLTASATDSEEARVVAVASLLRGGAWEEGFAPLPETLGEARGLEDLARQGGEERAVIRLEDAQASRASIEELAPKARFLHLATHGWFAPESIRSWSDPEPVDSQGHAIHRSSAEERIKGSSPMVLCGLALAGANLPTDAIGRQPGLVTAEEISGWDLENCELAVLSACDTNVGERRAGQGVASLQKALHMAGARTVVTSLWKVPDEATKDLMLDFYRRIWVEKKPKAQALWEAKMRLRSAKDESGGPKYLTRDWAAWVLTGDPD